MAVFVTKDALNIGRSQSELVPKATLCFDDRKSSPVAGPSAQTLKHLRNDRTPMGTMEKAFKIECKMISKLPAWHDELSLFLLDGL